MSSLTLWMLAETLLAGRFCSTVRSLSSSCGMTSVRRFTSVEKKQECEWAAWFWLHRIDNKYIDRQQEEQDCHCSHSIWSIHWQEIEDWIRIGWGAIFFCTCTADVDVYAAKCLHTSLLSKYGVLSCLQDNTWQIIESQLSDSWTRQASLMPGRNSHGFANRKESSRAVVGKYLHLFGKFL